MCLDLRFRVQPSPALVLAWVLWVPLLDGCGKPVDGFRDGDHGESIGVYSATVFLGVVTSSFEPCIALQCPPFRHQILLRHVVIQTRGTW